MADITSIIIPCYNLDDELVEVTHECFKSLKEHTKNYELIVIDNASELGSEMLLRVADTYVHNSVNLGNGAAWNQGARLARGKYFVFMDNDVIVKKDWLEPMIQKVQDKQIGVAFPALKNRDEDGYSERLAGCCWIVRRELWQEIGEIDEEYGLAYFEDTDYFWRVQSSGYKLAPAPPSRVYHMNQTTGNKLEKLGKFNKKELHDKNARYFARKHGEVHPRFT